MSVIFFPKSNHIRREGHDTVQAVAQTATGRVEMLVSDASYKIPLASRKGGNCHKHKTIGITRFVVMVHWRMRIVDILGTCCMAKQVKINFKHQSQK